MGKGKLAKFAEMERLERVYQYPFSQIKALGDCPMRGAWHNDCFGNTNPIVLELGCGRGEYAVGLAQTNPQCNFIGIDIKGARMWHGAKEANSRGLTNCAFLRTEIELLEHFFAPGEVDRIWITFPDPQMKKTGKRLTGTRLLGLYRKFLRPGGTICLKTDSPFLYAYTRRMLQLSGITPVTDIADLYAQPLPEGVPDIKTYYERQWLARGLTIKLLCFSLDPDTTLVEPTEEFEPDTYRSYGRSARNLTPQTPSDSQ